MSDKDLDRLLDRVRVRSQENVARRLAYRMGDLEKKYGITTDMLKHEISFAAHIQELLFSTLKYAALPYKFVLPGIMNYSLYGNRMLRYLERASGQVEGVPSKLYRHQEYELRKWKTLLHKHTYLKEPPEVGEMIRILKAYGLYEKQRKGVK